MKFLRATVLAAVAVASAAVAHADAGVPGARVAYEAGLLLEGDESAELPASYFLRRGLQAGSGPGTTAPPPTTTAPPPTTTAPPPTTTAPPPTTTAPPPTTPPPTTTAPPTTTTPPPTTPGPTTATPETTTPAPTDKKDGSGTNSTTPPPTTAGPTTTKPPSDAGSVAAGGSEASETGSKGASSGPKKLTDNSSGGGSDATTESKSNKMSTGTIIGIVGGIVVGVGILAVIAVVLARKRREEDDDPLSPFELSMDKGYNAAAAGAGYGGQPQNNNNQYGNGSAVAYGGGARPNNAAAIGGAAAVGAAAGVGAGMMMTTDTPSAGADAAGVAYTQFYDPVTSPSSMYHQEQTQSSNNYASDLASARTDPSNNGSNLWMSAMEPKENDVEGATGASVPPVVSLPEDLANNSSFVSRNSYDELPGSSVDIDQSSVLSGGSDLEKDFPDYEDGSSRGSYEL